MPSDCALTARYPENVPQICAPLLNSSAAATWGNTDDGVEFGLRSILAGIGVQVCASAPAHLHQGQYRGEAGPPPGKPSQQEDRQPNPKRPRNHADQGERRHTEASAGADKHR